MLRLYKVQIFSMNVLVVRPDHIGDMLLTTPFFASMRRSFPEWNITVLCGSWSKPILDNNPNYDRIVVCDFPWLARVKPSLWKEFYSAVVKLRREKFDIVITLRKAAKSAVVSRFIGGRERWGFDVGKSRWAHTRAIHYHTDCHIADLYEEFVTALGGKPVHTGLELYFQQSEYDAFAQSILLPERYAVISPGAGYPEKLWFIERWAEAADYIIERYAIPVVFTGSSNEQQLVNMIIEKMYEKAVTLAGKLSIRETAIVIQKSQFLATVDSAAMHIASAVRTPAVALFGPTNPVHWGPYPNGRANQVISKVKQFTLGRGSTNKSGGMEDITTNDVKEAIDRLCSLERIQMG